MKKQWFAGCLPAGVAGLLCLLMLFGQPAAASSQSEQVKGEGDVTVLPSELFEALFGESEEELTSAERAALDALSEISLRYNRSIPDTDTFYHNEYSVHLEPRNLHDLLKDHQDQGLKDVSYE